MSFVWNWHLSQKELQSSTVLTPLSGESEPTGERVCECVCERGRENEGGKERERQRVRKEEVRYFQASCWHPLRAVFNTQMCNMLKDWTRSPACHPRRQDEKRKADRRVTH